MGKLYNALNSIEDGRKECIKNLNKAGIETGQDSSLFTVASNILKGPNADIKIPIYEFPSKYPDGSKILESLKNKYPGEVPVLFMLLEQSASEITITKQVTQPLYSRAICSDGKEYPELGTITFDTSKDIIIDTIPYRWVVLFVNTESFSKVSSQVTLDLMYLFESLTISKRCKSIILSNLNAATFGNNPNYTKWLRKSFLFIESESTVKTLTNGLAYIKIEESCEESLSVIHLPASVLRIDYLNKGTFYGTQELIIPYYPSGLLVLNLPNREELEFAIGSFSSSYNFFLGETRQYLNIPKVKTIRCGGYSSSNPYVSIEFDGRCYNNLAKHIDIKGYASFINHLYRIKDTSVYYSTDSMPYNAPNNSINISEGQYDGERFLSIFELTDQTSAPSIYIRKDCASIYLKNLESVTDSITIGAEIVEIYMPKLIGGKFTENSFTNLETLREINLGKDIQGAINLNFSRVSLPSIINIIQNLHPYTDGTTHKLLLHANIKEILTEDQKAAISSKGWTLV